MTLVWNQRTTLETKGEGGKRTREEEPVALVNQRARGAETSRLRHAPPRAQSRAELLPREFVATAGL